MNYLLGQMVWSEDLETGWHAPHPADRIIDLRNLAACGTPVTQQGHVLIATERDPLPGEVLIASAFNESLTGRLDGVKDLLGIPEALTVSTLPELIRRLLGVYSDPDVGLICPPLMPNHRGAIRFNLGEISEAYAIPASGVERDNILKVAQLQYRSAREAGTGVHRKLLSVLQRKFRVENHEIFIPQDLPKETPVKPTTTVRDNFNVGDHSELNGQASSQGWTWSKIEGGVTGIFRTNTTAYAEGVSVSNDRGEYRADEDLSSVDHYAQGSIRSESNSMFIGLLARKDSSATLTHYDVQGRWADEVLRVRKRVAGTFTTIQDNAQTLNTATFYLVRYTITGSNHQTFVAGVQVGADVTDTAIAAGTRCGITCICNTGVTSTGGVEDFEASDGLVDFNPDHYYRQMRMR